MINRRGFISSLAGLVAFVAGPKAKAKANIIPHAASASQPTCEVVRMYGESDTFRYMGIPRANYPGTFKRCGGEFVHTALYRVCQLPANHPGPCGDPGLPNDLSDQGKIEAYINLSNSAMKEHFASQKFQISLDLAILGS